MQETSHGKEKPLATNAAGMAEASVPQYGQAGLLTVGGDGGTGSVTLTNPGETTDLGSVIALTGAACHEASCGCYFYRCSIN